MLFSRRRWKRAVESTPPEKARSDFFPFWRRFRWRRGKNINVF